MSDLSIGCYEVIIVQQPSAVFTVQKPDNDVNILVPVGGPPGPRGPAGISSSEASVRYTYLDPVELPDGVRTHFTVPTEYVVGTLAVYLNGLLEHHIIQLTNTTFSFDTAPLSGDTLKIDFNTPN